MKRILFSALAAVILIAGCGKKSEMTTTTSADTSHTDTVNSDTVHKVQGKLMKVNLLRGIGNPTTTITPPAVNHPEQPLIVQLAGNPDIVIIAFSFAGDQSILQEITFTTPEGVQVFANQQMVPNTHYLGPGQENTYITSDPGAHYTLAATFGNGGGNYGHVTTLSGTGFGVTQYFNDNDLHQSIISVIAVP